MATPIGNLRDITLRALDVLAAADVIACEDTRTTGRLLKAHGIATRMTPYHEHNAARVRPGLLRRLESGEVVALVSDAGTPLISDPGFRLVSEVQAAGIDVVAVPGPSAALAALVASGMATDRFLFAGFLPARGPARRSALSALAGIDMTLVFFESARRLPGSLKDMAAVLGPREAMVARELTKIYEELRRASLPDLVAHYAEAGPPKGEVVVVVGPPEDPPGDLDDAGDIDEPLRAALEAMSLKDAVAAVSGASGRARREVYARALEIRGGSKK
ncbi:MAG: 16S rRNA (cytidine(1402)-2'-O)-methyltransferase [Alphaproteobacteria bacterium]|nr:16S rRNA (cytidine(1402)-2'-O)-methyltransferase [Alphaproteobacteria bacterium]MDP6603000.1 16S rRNA (cytidine(1402)-2'-O)-methyltransferase [Rhodospirillales bacterium]